MTTKQFLKSYAPTESQEQSTVISWAQKSGDKRLKWLYHVPNERISETQRKILAGQGVKKGVADLFLPHPTAKYHGLYIEMKSLNGKPSEAQKQFLADMTAEGYYAVVCYGAADAIETIIKYLRGAI